MRRERRGWMVRASVRRWIASLGIVLAAGAGLFVGFGAFAGSASGSGSCTPVTPYAKAVAATSGVVSFWRLGDSSGSSACDSVGSNTGTYSSGTTLGRTGAIAGDSGTAVSFNGSSGSVSVPSASSLNTADSFSFETWVKRGSTGTVQTIASKGSGAWVLEFTAANAVALGQVSSTGSVTTIVTSTTTITDTTSWHYLAVTKSGSTVHLYIDGTDVTGTVSNKTLTNSTAALQLGVNGSSAYLNGTLDDAALYSGALTSNQVVNHYRLGLAACYGASTPYPLAVLGTSGLVGYWRLGEASGTTACDSTGANPGVISAAGVTLAKTGALASDPGTAALFNGTSGNVSIPAASSLNVGDSFSIEAWVKRGSTSTTALQTIASKQTGAWALAFNASNDLELLSGSSTVIATSTTAVSDTTSWHYVVATKSGSSVHLYIDGVNVTGTVTNTTLTNNTSPLQLGENGTSAFLNGTLEEVGLYNTPLTATQIQAHYAAGIIPNLTAPAVTGSAVDGQTLTAGNGSWGGSPTGYAFQWQLCNTAGTGCAPITGQTSQTLTLVPGDVGSTVRAVVTASNAKAANTATSPQTATVSAAAPSDTNAPVITGTTTDGQTLTASNGSWTGTPPLAYTYQWQRCDQTGHNCQNIAGATNQAYTLAPADVGHTVLVVVTASNSAGSAMATSPTSTTIAAVPPASTAAPAISGTAEYGDTLTASTGTWSGDQPISYAYQWERCDQSGQNCAAISGATTSSYVVGGADVGDTILLAVTAINAGGTATATSATSTIVTAVAPAATGAPTITGTTTDGQTLTATPGAWSGDQPMSYTYVWYDCDQNGQNCRFETSGSQSTYQLSPYDVGQTIEVQVTATNPGGSATQTSDPTGVVANTPAPTIGSVSHSNLPSGSVSNGTDDVTVTANSQAPGIQSIQILDAAGDEVAGDYDYCYGTQGRPCPQTMTQTLTVDYSDLPIGDDTLTVTATDAAGQTSAGTSWTVNVEVPSTCSDTWTGAGDGTDWADANNWDNGVPGGHDYACLGSDSNVTLTSPYSFNVGRVDDQGSLTLASGTLSVNDSADASTVANLSLTAEDTYYYGVLAGAGEVDVTNSLNWTNQAAPQATPGFSGSGKLVIEPGATADVALSNNALGQLYAPLVNEGDLVVSSGVLDVESGAQITNAAGATMEIDAEGTIQTSYYGTYPAGIGGQGTVVNHGTLIKADGTGATTIGDPFENDGTVSVQSAGTLRFAGGGGSGNQTASLWRASTTGSAISLTSGSFSLGSDVEMSGTIDINGGSIDARDLQGADSDITISGGSLSLDSQSVSSTVADLTLDGTGELTGAAELDVTGDLAWTAGNTTMAGSGSTVVMPNATAQLSFGGGSAYLADGRTLLNEGSLVFSDGQLTAQGSGETIQNASGATMDLNAEGSSNQNNPGAGLIEAWCSYGCYQAGTAELVNDGTVDKAAGAGTTNVQFPIDNEGTVRSDSGTLALGGGTVSGAQDEGNWSTSNAGTIELTGSPATSGMYTLGTFTVAGNVIDATQVTASDVQATGTLTVDGSLTTLSSSVVSHVGTLDLDGDLTGPGDVDVANDFDWSGGQMDGTGATVVEPGATAELSFDPPGYTTQSAFLEDGRTLRNEGTLTFSSGELAPEGTGETIDNTAGATMYLNTEDGGVREWSWTPGSPWHQNGVATLTNEGTIDKSAGTGTTTMQLALRNTGTISADTGTLDFDGDMPAGVTQSGQWTTSPSGTIEMGVAGDPGQNAGFTFGTFNIAGNVLITADVTAGQVQDPTGTVTIDSGGDLTVRDSGVPSQIGTLNLQVTQYYYGSTLAGPGEVDIDTALNWTAPADGVAAMTGSGITRVMPGATATIDFTGDPGYSYGAMAGGRVLENNGTMDFVSGAIEAEGSQPETETIENASGGTLEMNSTRGSYGSNFPVLTGNGQLLNAGELTKTTASTTTIDWPFDNEGTVTAQSGELDFAGGSPAWYQSLTSMPTISNTQCAGPADEEGAWQTYGNASINLAAGCFLLGAQATLAGNFIVGGYLETDATQANNANVSVQYEAGLNIENQPDSNQATTLGQLTLDGTISGPGELDISQGFNWSQYGVLDGPGAVVLEQGSNSQINLPLYIYPSLLGGALVNHGTLTWNSGWLTSLSPAVIWNDGTLYANADGGYLGSGNTVLYNTGTIQKTAGTGATQIESIVYDPGSILPASSGQLYVNGLNSTPPADDGGPGWCASDGISIAAGWVNLVSDPFEVVAGYAGEDCADGGEIVGGGAELDAGGYGSNAQLTNASTQYCNPTPTLVCNLSLGATLRPGNSGYFTEPHGAGYEIDASFDYLLPGNPHVQTTGDESVGLQLPPGTSTTSVLPASTRFGGGNPGSPNTPTATCSDPVMCASGDQTESQQDLAVDGTGGEFDLTRTYNSQLAMVQTVPSAFGYGWTGPFDATLSIDPTTGNATVQNANGSTTTFTQGSYGYTAPVGSEATLTEDGHGDYDYTLPSQEVLTFDPSGALLRETDRVGDVTSFVRNDAGQVTEIDLPSGRAIDFTYNAQGLVATATDPEGLQIDYSYDQDENLVEVDDNSGVSAFRWKFGYDGQHEMTSMTDADNRTTSIEYTGGKVTEQTDPAGRQTTWSYSAGETDITQPGGSVTRELFDANGDPLAIMRALGTSSQSTQTYTYNAALEPTTMTDGAGNTTYYHYDQAGNLTQETDPDGGTSTWTYGAERDLLTSSTPSSSASYTYNSAGDLTSITRPGPNGDETTSMTYDAQNNLKSKTDPRGNTTTYDYDQYGDLSLETDASGDQEGWTYDADGRPLTEISPRGNVLEANPSDYTTTYTYDAQGRLTAESSPGGHTEHYGYDAAGNQTSVEDPDQNTTTTVYNGDDQPTEVDKPDGFTIHSSYNGAGLLASQTDGAGNTTTYSYNPLGQLTSSTDPDQRTTSYAYDSAGNLRRVTEPDGRNTTFDHDGDGHVTQVSYSDSTPGATFSYNTAGQVMSMTDQTGTSTYHYDSLGRLTSETNGDNQTVNYSYDLDDNLVGIEYPDGTQVTRTYNNDEELSAVSDGLGDTIDFSYDPDGNLSTSQFPNQQTDGYEYNAADELTGEQFDQNTTTVASLSYQRNPDGEITQESQTGLPGPASTNYSYTATNQLQTAGGESYAYDSAGNPTMFDGAGGYVYDAAGQLESSPAGSYTYDGLGERVTSTPTGGATTTYAYDEAGRLTSVDPGSGPSTSYVYDGQGLLASETTGSGTSQFAWDMTASTPLMLTDGSSDYIYGPNDLPVEQISSSGQVTFLHQDQLGSTRLLTNTDGTVSGTYSYSPFGVVTGRTGTGSTPLQYAGQYTDPSTGLQYDQERFYDPSTGSFLTRDPLEASTRQPYVYAADNPTSLTDPTGLSCSLFSEALGFLGGLFSNPVQDVLYLDPEYDIDAFAVKGIQDLSSDVGGTLATDAGAGLVTEDTTTLYRAVGDDEFNDAISSQEFRAGPNSMEGKWFAEQPSDALQWGQKFYGNEPFHVLQTDVPSSYADSLFSNPNLDGIGSARYADDLNTLNSVHGGISEYRP